jgi:hypothetical protein
MQKHFVAALQIAVQRSTWSIEALAAKLDKRPSTLYAELNPWGDTTHKLGLEDAIRIMDIMDDHTPLLTINSHFNLTAKQNNRQPDGKNMEEECLQGFQAVAAFIQAVRDEADTAEIVRLCCAACDELNDVAKRVKMERNPGLREVG